MRSDCSNRMMLLCLTFYFLSDSVSENVQSHLLAIDHGGSLVVTVQYYSQTVSIVMDQS